MLDKLNYDLVTSTTYKTTYDFFFFFILTDQIILPSLAWFAKEYTCFFQMPIRRILEWHKFILDRPDGFIIIGMTCEKVHLFFQNEKFEEVLWWCGQVLQPMGHNQSCLFEVSWFRIINGYASWKIIAWSTPYHNWLFVSTRYACNNVSHALHLLFKANSDIFFWIGYQEVLIKTPQRIRGAF